MARNFTAASSQYLEETGTAQNYVQNATAMTISLWMKMTGVATEQKPIAQWNGNFNESTFLADVEATTGKFQFVVADSGGTNTSSRRTVASVGVAGLWEHWLVTWTATDTIVIYKNGVSQTIEAWIGGPGISTIGSNANLPKLAIGRAADGGYFNGDIAAVGMWTRVLTSTEIADLAAGKSPLFMPQNLVSAPDLSGQNNPEVDNFTRRTFSVFNGPIKSVSPDNLKYPGGQKNRIGRPRPFAPGIAR